MRRGLGRHNFRSIAAAAAAAGDAFWSYVTMLLPGNGTNGAQNNTFLDASTNNFTITRNGNTTQGTFTPFALSAPYSTATRGGSMYFDGTGDYLTLANNAAFKPGASTNAFTVECWVYPTATPGTDTAVYGNYVVTSYPTNTDGFDLLYQTTRSVAFRWGYPNYADSGSSSALSLNTWNHVVVCRNTSGSMSCYLNGTRWFNTSTNTSITDSTAASFWVGWAGSLSGSTINPFPGYISNFRLVKGTAVYDPTQTTLTVPTAPLTAITNTSLLLLGTNAGVIDNAMLNDLETVGTAQISTTQSKFGGSSMSLPGGAGNYLFASSNAGYGMGTGDFTIECWVYPTAAWAGAGSYNPIVYVSGTGIYFGQNGTGFGLRQSGTADIISYGTSPTLNTWTHVAVVRSGTTCTLYYNGTSVATATSSANFSAGNLQVGSDGSYSYTGYIDDLRITKGYARYTANFTPPTAAFSTSGPYLFAALPSSGSPTYSVNNTVLDSTGTSYTTYGSVLSSTNTSYKPI